LRPYTTTTGFYSGDNGYFNRTAVDHRQGGRTAERGRFPRTGVFSAGSGFPTDSYGGSNYWVDVVVRHQLTSSRPKRDRATPSGFARSPGSRNTSDADTDRKGRLAQLMGQQQKRSPAVDRVGVRG